MMQDYTFKISKMGLLTVGLLDSNTSKIPTLLY